jgi:hypothetical protein
LEPGVSTFIPAEFQLSEPVLFRAKQSSANSPDLISRAYGSGIYGHIGFCSFRFWSMLVATFAAISNLRSG